MIDYQNLPHTDYPALYAFIEKHTDRADRYIQLAEELGEAQKACLKMARALKGEPQLQNKIPLIIHDLREEFTDVEVVKSTLRFRDFDEEIFDAKLRRWYERLEEAHRQKLSSQDVAPDPLIELHLKFFNQLFHSL